MTAFDKHMMGIALAMAERGLGQTAPNPSVGAVIADEAREVVLARAVTRPGGRPHAETEAIRKAGAAASGKTLYVTLEPCAHHGKTPPCADAIIAAGIKRVVVGIGDPDPRTAGEGIARLNNSGIAVTEGVCGEEAGWLARGHALRVTEGRPFVQLKLALDANGNVPRGSGGKPTFVTCAEARAAGHLMRARADAILVGANTLRDDDPDLTCRLPGLAARSPRRIVVGTNWTLPPTSRLAKSAEKNPVWLFAAGQDAKSDAEPQPIAGVTVFTNDKPGSCYAAADILSTLAEKGVTRLLVEGGPAMWELFAPAADEVVVFKAGRKPLETSPLALLGPRSSNGELKLARVRQVGEDLMFVYRRAGK